MHKNLKNGFDIYETVQVSKVCTRRNNDEAVCLAVLFFDVLPSHTNIMTDKGFNLFDECAARCLHLSLIMKSVPILPEGTVRFTHLAS